MPDPKLVPRPTPDFPLPQLALRGRRAGDDETAPPYGGNEQAALLARLSQEVAALRAALDASRQRIAKLEVEASEDPVSGLLNQRALLREIDRAAEFHGKYRAQAALALISADGMAGVAERHGQRFAHRLLRTMGDRLRGSIRSCDIAARIEPYQFAVVLWNAPAADCGARLDRMRAALGGMDRLLEGRVASIRIRAVATAIDGAKADAVMASAEALLAADAERAVRR